MKHLVLVLFPLLFFLSPLHGQATEETPENSVALVMRKLGPAFRNIQKLKAVEGEDLTPVLKFQSLTQEALSLMPRKVELIEDESERAKALIPYKLLMSELYHEAVLLEQAHRNFDADNFQKQIQRLKDLQTQGHEAFRKRF